MGNEREFVIEEGVLLEYTGTGGNVIIPVGVVEIGENAFARCTKLTGVIIPPTVKKIGACAFYACINLPKVKLPPELESIGDYAFYACERLQEVDDSECEYDEGNGVFDGTPWWNEEYDN